jgi:Spy/CpxP family protein refolding chaperone
MGAGQQRGGRMMAMLFQGITLTATQQQKVDSISAAYRHQMPAFTPGTPPTDEERAKRRELMQKQTADLRAVLTADQQKVFDQNLEQMRSRMQQRSVPPGR